MEFYQHLADNFDFLRFFDYHGFRRNKTNKSLCGDQNSRFNCLPNAYDSQLYQSKVWIREGAQEFKGDRRILFQEWVYYWCDKCIHISNRPLHQNKYFLCSDIYSLNETLERNQRYGKVWVHFRQFQRKITILWVNQGLSHEFCYWACSFNFIKPHGQSRWFIKLVLKDVNW